MTSINRTAEQPGLPPLVAIVGPTGVGKTALSLAIARARPHWHCEIVSADSRQIYRYMDIGTAKATVEERSRVVHHLIDIVDPDEPYTLADFQLAATGNIRSIHTRGGLPLLTGGSGLYIRAILDGLEIPPVPPNTELRAELESLVARQGTEALHSRLAQLDPASAATIDSRNARRMIRAIEVTLTTGIPFSQQRTRRPVPYRLLTLGLTLARSQLYKRIDHRIEAMIHNGLVNEVEALLSMGYGRDLPSLSGIGYAQAAAYLHNEISLEQMRKDIEYATHRFARHQYAWFRPTDPEIHWIDIASQDPLATALDLLDPFMHTAA